jgi:hypothetical protein
LRDLRLIRRIGRIELTAQEQLVDGGWDVMVVHPRAQERQHRRAGVFRGERAQVAHERRLVERGRDGQRSAKTNALRDRLEELVDGALADDGEHLSDFFGRVGKVAHRF